MKRKKTVYHGFECGYGFRHLLDNNRRYALQTRETTIKWKISLLESASLFGSFPWVFLVGWENNRNCKEMRD